MLRIYRLQKDGFDIAREMNELLSQIAKSDVDVSLPPPVSLCIIHSDVIIHLLNSEVPRQYRALKGEKGSFNITNHVFYV